MITGKITNIYLKTKQSVLIVFNKTMVVFDTIIHTK